MPDLDTSWLEDEDFLWQAAGELLLALGVTERDVARLPELRRALASLDTTDGTALVPGAAPGTGRRPLTGPELARQRSSLEVVGRLGLPVAQQTLDRLEAEGIATETLGVSEPAARRLVLRLQGALEDPSWRTMDEDELEAYAQEVLGEEQDPLWVRPTEPASGEVRRMVGVVRRMPKETVVRIARVWNPLALRGAITVGLHLLRKAGPGTQDGAPGAPWAPPSEAGLDSLDAVEQQRRTWDERFLEVCAQMVGLGQELPTEAVERVRRLIAERDAAGAVLSPEVEAALRPYQPRPTAPGATGYGDWSGVGRL